MLCGNKMQNFEAMKVMCFKNATVVADYDEDDEQSISEQMLTP